MRKVFHMRKLLASLLLATTLSFAANVPRPAGEYAFELPSGQQVLLSKYRGKVVLLAFFSTTCPHCQNSARMMEKLQSEYGPQGFQALGVCFNDMAKLLTPDFIKYQKLTFPVGYSTQDQVLPYVQHPQGAIPYVPMFVFIDRMGVIRHQALGGEEFFRNEEPNTRAQLVRLLSGGAGGTPAKKAAPAPTPGKKS